MACSILNWDLDRTAGVFAAPWAGYLGGFSPQTRFASAYGGLAWSSVVLPEHAFTKHIFTCSRGARGRGAVRQFRRCALRCGAYALARCLSMASSLGSCGDQPLTPPDPRCCPMDDHATPAEGGSCVLAPRDENTAQSPLNSTDRSVTPSVLCGEGDGETQS